MSSFDDLIKEVMAEHDHQAPDVSGLLGWLGPQPLRRLRRTRRIRIVRRAAVVAVAAVAVVAAIWIVAPKAPGRGPLPTNVTRQPWTAIGIPGLPGLNAGGSAAVMSVACAAAGDCVAGGTFSDRRDIGQAFIAGEQGGTWGAAMLVPGTTSLNRGDLGAVVTSVACPSPGECTAAGHASPRPRQMQVFVADEHNGRWGTARWLPRLAVLNLSGHAEVTGLSCSSAGNCAVVGWYLNSANNHQAFAANERQGTWGSATAIPAVMALNVGADAQLSAVSCASAGNCDAGGYYADAAGRHQALLVSERNGTWASAIAVPGTDSLNVGGSAAVTAISCPAAGNCEAGGFYSSPGSGEGMPFIVSERDGTWGTALTVPGVTGLNRGHEGGISSLACASPGDCVAGGSYLVAPGGNAEAFVAAERGGTWSRAVQVPGSGALNAGGDAEAFSVTCSSAGNCVAGGYYTDGAGQASAFIATERNGAWEAAAPLPGMPALSGGGASGIASVSCAAAGYCVAGGFYQDAHGSQQAFVTVGKRSRWMR